MKLRIDGKIFERFPRLNIGVVVAKGIENSAPRREVTALIGERQKEIREKFSTETLSQQPKIDSWRKAYSSFGGKPKKNKCSVEALYRSALKGDGVRSINKIVDIYNYISLKHMVPAGGDDLDKVEGDIVLKFASGSESFQELNSAETKSPKQGEVVYCDDREVLCRRWNWRECDKSKMTQETKNVCLVVEGLPPFSGEEIESIAAELGELVKKHCGGEARTLVLNRENPEAEIFP